MNPRLPVIALVLAPLWVLSLGDAAAGPRPPGCGPAATSESAALEIFARARAQEQFPQAAAAAWDAWCASAQPGHLINACLMNVKGRQCREAQELVGYLERNGRLRGELLDKFAQCKRGLQQLRCAGPALPNVIVEPVPPPPAQPPPAAAGEVTVHIKTRPSGASVLIDGQERGVRTDGSLKLAPGVYPLRLVLAGHKPLERSLQVSSTAEQAFHFDLTQEATWLDLRLMATDRSAEGALVHVDSQLRGQIPQRIEVAAGSHVVEVAKEGYHPWYRTVEVRPGETAILLPQLLQRPAPAAPAVAAPVVAAPAVAAPVVAAPVAAPAVAAPVVATPVVAVPAVAAPAVAAPVVATPAVAAHQPAVVAPQPVPVAHQPVAPPAAPPSPAVPPPPALPGGKLTIELIDGVRGAQFSCGPHPLSEEKIFAGETLLVPVGRCLLQMQKEGYQTITREILITERTPLRIFIPFRPARAAQHR